MSYDYKEIWDDMKDWLRRALEDDLGIGLQIAYQRALDEMEGKEYELRL